MVRDLQFCNREYEDKLVFTVCRRAFSQLFLPIPMRTAIALFRSVKYIRAGLSALLHGGLSVAVLDATAVTVSMMRGDFDNCPYRQVGKCGARSPKDFCFSPLPAATSQALRASSP